jgi:hypothetical protein
VSTTVLAVPADSRKNEPLAAISRKHLSGSEPAGTGTGEESLSIAINELAVSKRPDFPPVLFAWDVCDADIRAADYAYE